MSLKVWPFMVLLSSSSEKVALRLAVGATSIALALGEVLVTLGGVVSEVLGCQSKRLRQ
jgi:hypothetical protein